MIDRQLVFDGRNIFPISFTCFHVLAEVRPAFTFIVNVDLKI